MNKTGQTTSILRNSGAVQLTVDAGTVEKTIMQKSIVTPETTVRTQPTAEEATLRTTKWTHPVLLVSKPRSDKQRLCCDVRQLNKHTRTITYPTLELPNFLVDIGSKQCKYFSCIDLKAAYKQIPLSKIYQEICTFTCASGNFPPTTAIFGLKNIHNLQI